MAFKKPSHLITRRFFDRTLLVSNARGASAQTLIELNETAGFLWGKLDEVQNSEELANHLESEFEINSDEAKEGVEAFFVALRNAGVEL